MFSMSDRTETVSLDEKDTRSLSHNPSYSTLKSRPSGNSVRDGGYLGGFLTEYSLVPFSFITMTPSGIGGDGVLGGGGGGAGTDGGGRGGESTDGFEGKVLLLRGSSRNEMGALGTRCV